MSGIEQLARNARPRARAARRRSTRRHWVAAQQKGGSLACILALLGLWQWAASAHAINGQLFGSPAGIVAAFRSALASGTLVSDTLVTAWETLAGLAIGSLTGTLAGLALWFTPDLARPAEGFSVVLNSVPKIALGPLIVIWFGSGTESKIWLAAVSTYAVSMIAATAAMREIDHDLVNLFRSLGASRRMMFRKLIVPSAVPWIFSTLRMNVGFALIGAVVGEFIASQQGLGHAIFVAGSLFDLNTVWLGIILLTLLAALLTWVIRLLEERLVTWKPTA